MPRPVTFWFEFASTYAYLSAMRIDAEAQKLGVEVEWKPFVLGPIFAAQGWNTSPFKIYPAKGKNMWRDLERRAEKYGLPFTRPTDAAQERFPQRSTPAARVACVGLDNAWGRDFVRLLYTAQWTTQADISDSAVIASCVGSAGGDPENAMDAAQSPEIRAQLRQNTQDAMAAGLYGTPSFTVGDELFWGDDRLADALEWAAKA